METKIHDDYRQRTEQTKQMRVYFSKTKQNKTKKKHKTKQILGPSTRIYYPLKKLKVNK